MSLAGKGAGVGERKGREGLEKCLFFLLQLCIYRFPFDVPACWLTWFSATAGRQVLGAASELCGGCSNVESQVYDNPGPWAWDGEAGSWPQFPFCKMGLSQYCSQKVENVTHFNINSGQ